MDGDIEGDEDCELSLLNDTYDKTWTYHPIWNFLDKCFDDAARDSCLNGGLESIVPTVEDYCIYRKITEIPPLYKVWFDAKIGFLTITKMPRYMSPMWLQRFPNPITFDANRFDDFVQYLKDNLHKRGHNDTLWQLRKYIADENISVKRNDAISTRKI